MPQNTLHQQTAKFIAKVTENLPMLSSSTMQELIQNPRALQSILFTALVPEDPLLQLVKTIPLTLAGNYFPQAIFDLGMFSDIDDGFIKYKDEKQLITGAESVEIYSLNRRARFDMVFRYVSMDLNSLCFTQDQVGEFVHKYSDTFEGFGNITFMLITLEGKFFVVGLEKDEENPEKTCPTLYELDNQNMWDGLARFVVPKVIRSRE